MRLELPPGGTGGSRWTRQMANPEPVLQVVWPDLFIYFLAALCSLWDLSSLTRN